jgi:nucleotide-binding universal stress UspA family protein
VTPAASGPVVFAYDGSPLSKLAIDEAAHQLAPGRDALVVTVFKTFDLEFIPVGEAHFDTASAAEVRRAADETAAAGAALATAAGFRARSVAQEASPSWKGIVEVADAQSASLIVLGSHGRSGFPGVLLGSVAEAVAAHSKRPVLIVHRG